MREPRLGDWKGNIVLFSQATADDLLEVVRGNVVAKNSPDIGNPLPPDSDFRRRYAAILLNERGL